MKKVGAVGSWEVGDEVVVHLLTIDLNHFDLVQNVQAVALLFGTLFYLRHSTFAAKVQQDS